MIDFNKYGKSGSGTRTQTSTATLPSSTPDVAPTMSTSTPVKPTGSINFNKYGKSSSTPQIAEQPKKELGFVGSLVEAPATMVARPFQAIEAVAHDAYTHPELMREQQATKDALAENDALLAQYRTMRDTGQDTTAIKQRMQDNINKISASAKRQSEITSWQPFSGGVVAEAPKSWGDVKKDVGRGVQTVAFGLNPVAGGAAFGLGGSLEQGNDLFSAQTALQTVLGAGAGKALDLIGKPLLNAAGKVIGTITPKILTDLASKGAGAVTEFMAQHELAGGIAKPLAEKITTASDALEGKTGQLFKGIKQKTQDVVSSQYPGLSKKGLEDRFTTIERDNFNKPQTIKNERGYTKATDIANVAKKNGHDVGDIAVKSGITHDSIIDGNKYATRDTAEALRNDAAKTSHDLMRPALAEAEQGIPRVQLSDIRDKMISDINSAPASQVTDADRKAMIRKVNAEYGPGSPADLAHPDGYLLTDLHDSKIATSLKAKHNPFGTIADNITAKQNDYSSRAFRKVLEDVAPKELEIAKFNKELQGKFSTADYLDALDGKKAPKSIVQKAATLFGKALGAGAGSTFAGGLGGVAGYHLGGVLVNGFEGMSNPVKTAVLRNLERTQPEIFKAFEDYYGKAVIERLARLKLPAASQVDINLQGLRNESGAIPMGAPATPGPNKVMNDFTQNTRWLNNTKQLPAGSDAIRMPASGTPNPVGRPYTAGGENASATYQSIGGMRQRIFNGGGEIKNTRVDFSTPKGLDSFDAPNKKFMISSAENPMGKAMPDAWNMQKTAEFRKFLKDNNIHFTAQKGKYGGNPENSNIIEIDNPQQQAIIDKWLEANSPQAENIVIKNGKAVRYDPRTKEAYVVSIKGKDLSVPVNTQDFYSQIGNHKYKFPLYSDSEQPLSKEELMKILNR